MRRLLLAAMLLAGCASAQSMALGDFSGGADWYDRPGITREQFEADRDAAERRAMRPGLGRQTTSTLKSGVYNYLRELGYRTVPAKDAPGDWARYPPR